jgi:hypothetical protein
VSNSPIQAECEVSPPLPPGKGRGEGGDASPRPNALTLALSQRERGPVAGDLPVGVRVVALAEITGRLDGVKRLVVRRDAVVTPAVRDELLRRGIALARADSVGPPPAAVRLAVVASGTDFDPAALIAALGREGMRVEQSASDCLIAAVDRLASEVVMPGTLGLLLTVHVAAGLCVANRLRGVRAIAGPNAAAVAAAADAVGANLLVADPRGVAFFPLKQMVAEFCRGGVRPCPEVLRARLA